MKAALPFALLACAALTGCISTAASIVTAPVRAVGWTADKLTTSQSEADEKRGREIRKQEEKDGKAARKADKKQRKERQQESRDDRT